MFFRRSFNILFLLRKKLTTHSADTPCAISVAKAEPATPHLSTFINRIKSAMLIPAFNIMVSMERRGLPSAAMTPLSPNPTNWKTAARRMMLINCLAYGKISALAPKRYRRSSKKKRQTEVNTNEKINWRLKALPSICSASFFFCLPRLMDTRAVVPMPISMPKAIKTSAMGNVIPTPAKASFPTNCPTNTRSIKA